MDNLKDKIQNRLRNFNQYVKKAILDRRIPLFKRLIAVNEKEQSAWALYVMMVQTRIRKCREKKLSINYAKATPEQKRILEFMDIEVATMETLIAIPAQVIKQTAIEEQRRIEDELILSVKQEIERN